MRRISTGEWIVLGVVLVAISALAIIFFMPVVNRDPGAPRHLSEMPAIIVAAQAYYSEFSALPRGNTDDILKALQGDNPRKILFLEPSDTPMSDTWGTPYRVTGDKGTLIVSSAGPDRHWDTGDDIKKEKIIEQGGRGYGSPAAGSPSPHR